MKFKLSKKKKIVEKELASVKEKLMEAEEACESERAAKNEVDELLKEAQAEITELRNTTGTFKVCIK